MPIAQMNWGLLKYDMMDPKLASFVLESEKVYTLADEHSGFIWRLSPEILTKQLAECGWSDRSSVTVSVWNTLEDLKAFTYNTIHNEYLNNRETWYEEVSGPQLVIWDVEKDERPDFVEANRRLQHLAINGNSKYARGWDSASGK